jgi:hypothetical protein
MSRTPSEASRLRSWREADWDLRAKANREQRQRQQRADAKAAARKEALAKQVDRQVKVELARLKRDLRAEIDAKTAKAPAARRTSPSSKTESTFKAAAAALMRRRARERR